jgi:hypothetical protein
MEKQIIYEINEALEMVEKATSSREMSLAKTKLEEAKMWLQKRIVEVPEEQANPPTTEEAKQ